jgi:hypothetical protein
MEAPQVIARKFLNRTNRHIFLTGKAGTGKTTFLRAIVEETHKKAVIAAPTGVAAINAGGVTLHSLFQMPFGAFIPSDAYPFQNVPFEANTPKTLRRHSFMRGAKLRLIQELELLIIDEVSMLRADMLDAIDHVLRSVRRNARPFGGVQVLFIGDLLQLPPVVKEEEWSVLGTFYKSVHFFEAKALAGEPPLYIEFDKIYRQSDAAFIRLLNHLRDNKADEADVSLLNSCYRPDFRSGKDDSYIYLTTHNWKADKVNQEEMAKLSGKERVYDCVVKDDFKEHQYPVEAELKLKIGAQVMFLKNDVSGYRRYYNGKIGVVTELSKDGIVVGFADGSDEVEVEPYEWQNKRYRLDEVSNEVSEEIMGTFSQYPLRLAWAVTVHKSQGLTFDKAILDLERAFAPGQIYVALSRLTSLDGLVLLSKVPLNAFGKDRSVEAFEQGRPGEHEWDGILKVEMHKYLRDQLLLCYNFSDLNYVFGKHLETYTKDEKKSAKQRFRGSVLEVYEKFKREKQVAGKFVVQLEGILHNSNDTYLGMLKKRLVSALGYFEPKLKEMNEGIRAIIIELEDAVGVKGYLKELGELEGQVMAKLQQVRKSVALVDALQRQEDLGKESYLSEEEKAHRAFVHIASKTGKKKKAGKSGPKRKKGDSMQESFDLLKRGMSIEEISQKRGMRKETVANHLTGYLRSGALDIMELMEEEKVGVIRDAIDRHYSDSIVPVKKNLGEEYSYEEIRWVLACR